MILFLVGLLAILCQIVLLRELNVACYGVELVYGLALAVWLLAGGAGAAWRSRWRVASGWRVAWLLVLVALALPIDIAFVRASRLLLGGVPGAFLPIGRQLLVLAVSLGPPSFVLGLAFRRAAEAATLHGRALASCYALESAGAVVGAAAATLALVSGVQTFALAILAAGILAAAVLFVSLRKPVAGSTCVLAMLLAAPLAHDLDLWMTRWAHPAAVETRDSPYARITATVSGTQTAVFADDVLTFESESAQQEELADVAALLHPAPRRMLLLGGSVERLAAELGRHHPDRLDSVEMDRVFFELADRHLRLGSTPIFDDPRSFLRRETTYDLVVVALPEPTSGQANRFYTVEFFAECRRRLDPSGILAFRLALPENVVTPLLALRTASIVAAVRSAFPHVELLQGGSALVFASGAPFPAAPDILIDRWQARALETRLVTPSYLRYLYENDRHAALVRLGSAAVAPNSDARPACYPFAAINWLAKFYPELLRVDPAILATGLIRSSDGRPGGDGLRIGPAALLDPRLIGGVLLVVVVLLARRRPALRTTALAGFAGFAGMVLETVVLLAYQARTGALYERLGVLLTAFMAGLAVGAWLVARITSSTRRAAIVGRLTAALLAALAASGVATAALIWSESPMGLAQTGLVLLVGGAAVGGVFACAAVASGDERGSTIGRLYGADLAGGAAGSLLASLVLVPFAGLVPTTWIVVGLGLVALLLV